MKKASRTAKIVDTNVCVVSNRQGGTLTCASLCARELNDIVRGGILVVDYAGLVFTEYRKRLSFSGQPGAGDIFFKWFVDNRYNPTRVCQITLIPHQTRHGDFEIFPDDEALATFDFADRVYVALALSHAEHPPILNAVDSDYWHHKESLTKSGVNVVHVCGHKHYKKRT